MSNLRTGTELRCPSRIHGIFDADGNLEVKCSSKACGAGNGVVVFHYFNLETSELVRTERFQDPTRVTQTGKKKGTHQ